MVGLLIILVLLSVGSGGGEDCGQFKSRVCHLGLDNVLFLDNSSGGPRECQMGCFNRTSCEAFTFFTGEEQRCILFKSCQDNTAPCKGCVSGPVYPRGGKCFQQILDGSDKNSKTISSTALISRPSKTPATSKSFTRSLTPNPGIKSPFNSQTTISRNPKRTDIFGSFGTNRPTRPQSTLRKLRPANSVSIKKPRCLNNCQSQPNKENKVYNVDNGLKASSEDTLLGIDDSIHFPDDLDDDDDDDDNIAIDDGLLDDVYESLPTNNAKREPITPPPRRPTQATRRVTSPPRRTTGLTPSFTQVLPRHNHIPHTYCIMGGRNKNGPVAGISVLPTSNRWLPPGRSGRSPMGSFPSSMTRGNGRSFSTFSGQALNTCTPGYPVLNNFGTTYVPGSCNNYNFQTRQWAPSGGQMTTYRQGGSTLRIGKYLMTFGGVNHQYGHPIRSVDIFDPRRPHIGWRKVPQWSFPSAAQDQCTVVTKDPNGGTQVMVMGGVGQESTAMKLVVSRNQWFSLNPMLTPRSQHACTKVTLNNRPGVVVSGGINRHSHNMSSVDFFDLNSGRWVSLPGLSRGRRGHTMTSLDGKLAVLGGSSSTVQGDTEYLNDVEMFNGREWKPARIRMDQPRDGANIVKIPNHLIF